MEEEGPGGAPGTGESGSKGPHPVEAGSGTDVWERAVPEILAKDRIAEDVPCQRFWQFRYCEADGPREVCSQLHRLCNRWLKPEKLTKKQMVDLVVLEKFLAILSQEMQGWIRGCGPETSSQAVALAEGFLLSQAEEKRQAEQMLGRSVKIETKIPEEEGAPSEEVQRTQAMERAQDPLYSGGGEMLLSCPLFQGVETSAAPPIQGPISFEEVSVCFSEAEWALLDPGQRALYRDVMRENSENVAFLGSSGPNDLRRRLSGPS